MRARIKVSVRFASLSAVTPECAHNRGSIDNLLLDQVNNGFRVSVRGKVIRPAVWIGCWPWGTLDAPLCCFSQAHPEYERIAFSFVLLFSIAAGWMNRILGLEERRDMGIGLDNSRLLHYRVTLLRVHMYVDFIRMEPSLKWLGSLFSGHSYSITSRIACLWCSKTHCCTRPEWAESLRRCMGEARGKEHARMKIVVKEE